MKNTGTEFKQNAGLADDEGNLFECVRSEEDSIKRLIWIMGLYCRYAGYGGK